MFCYGVFGNYKSMIGDWVCNARFEESFMHPFDWGLAAETEMG